MKTVTKIALIALLWITVVNTGQLTIIDTAVRMQMAHAWWTGTDEISPDYQPKSLGDPAAGVKGVGGKRYGAYDIGQSLLMLPGDWLGSQLNQRFPGKVDDWRPYMINFLIFIPLNVAAVVSCFWLLRLFDFEERIAGLASIVWLLGTTVWHYAQVPQQNNQVLLFVTLGYATALAYIRYKRPHFAVLGGLALSAALLIRSTSIIHVLTVLLFFIGCIAYKSRNIVEIIKGVALWIAGFIPLVLLGRVFDYVRFGSFLTTGQSLSGKQLTTDPIWSGWPKPPANFPFTNPPHVGILGVLFSPAKSIFIYDPLLLPCLVLGISLWRRLSPYIQWYLFVGMFNLALHVVLTSRMVFWHGDSAWGARYHVTSVHLLLIPLIALFIERLLSAKALVAWLMRGILAVAIAVQVASVTMPFYLEDIQSQLLPPQPSLHFRLGERLTNLACLVNSSFSQGCISRLSSDQTKHGSPDDISKFPSSFSELQQSNKLFLLPFNLSNAKTLVFILWGAVLMLAIGTTVWFCFFAVI